MDHDRSDLKCVRETWHAFEPLNNFPLSNYLFFFSIRSLKLRWVGKSSGKVLYSQKIERPVTTSNAHIEIGQDSKALLLLNNDGKRSGCWSRKRAASWKQERRGQIWLANAGFALKKSQDGGCKKFRSQSRTRSTESVFFFLLFSPLVRRRWKWTKI